MGNLGQEAGPVSGAAVGIDPAAMFHAADGFQGELDNVVAGLSRRPGNETNPAGVVFELGAVQQSGLIRHWYQISLFS
jgi:hypothetical protein